MPGSLSVTQIAPVTLVDTASEVPISEPGGAGRADGGAPSYDRHTFAR
jgi:hypothetical protein